MSRRVSCCFRAVFPWTAATSPPVPCAPARAFAPMPLSTSVTCGFCPMTSRLDALGASQGALPRKPHSSESQWDARRKFRMRQNAQRDAGTREGRKMQRGKRGCRCRDIKITVSSGESEPSIAICNQREARGYLNVSAAPWAEGAALL